MTYTMMKEVETMTTTGMKKAIVRRYHVYEAVSGSSHAGPQLRSRPKSDIKVLLALPQLLT